MFQQAIENYLTTHHFDKLNLKAVLFDMDGVLFDSMKKSCSSLARSHEAVRYASESGRSIYARRTYRGHQQSI